MVIIRVLCLDGTSETGPFLEIKKFQKYLQTQPLKITCDGRQNYLGERENHLRVAHSILSLSLKYGKKLRQV